MPDHTLGDAPIEPQYRDKMNELAAFVDHYFNGDLRGKDRKVGFVLLLFSFGDTARANYISNADRADVVTLLRSKSRASKVGSEMKGSA